MTTGYGSSGDLSNTEIIKVNENCTTTLPDYPMDLRAATGMYVDEAIIICGGYTPHNNKCYQLKKEEQSFELVHTMEEKRYHAKSILVHGKMLVLGGYTGNSMTRTAEFINNQILNDTEFNLNIELPEPVFSHTIHNINKMTSILIGGYTTTTSESKKTYFYNHASNKWTSGPKLINGRMSHTAGVLFDHDTREQHIAVVGGWGLDSVELLLHGKNVWKLGTTFKIFASFKQFAFTNLSRRSTFA